MDLLELISSQLNNPNVLNKLGRSVNADSNQVKALAKIGLPTLLQALGRNANTPDGAESLAKALSRHQDEDVDDLEGFIDRVDTNDGSKILQHIFSGKKNSVQQNLANQTGLKSDQVSGLLSQLAPLLLSTLGQQKKQQNLDASGIAGLLNGVVSGRGGNNLLGMAAQMLDADKDGNIMDDLGDMLGGFLKRK